MSFIKDIRDRMISKCYYPETDGLLDDKEKKEKGFAAGGIINRIPMHGYAEDGLFLPIDKENKIIMPNGYIVIDPNIKLSPEQEKDLIKKFEEIMDKAMGTISMSCSGGVTNEQA